MTIRVLLTGGAGFIGSNLAKRCVEEGFETSIVDDLSNGHEEFVPQGIKKFYKSDFTAPNVLIDIALQKFDVVFHLAALPRVSYSVEHPIETNDTNVTKSLSLISTCRGNVKRIVFSSSSSVYGGADQLPTPETAQFNPKSPYALQKAIIEQYLRLYNETYGLESCCLRYFNVFGPNQLGSSPYATAVSAWLTAIKQGKPMRSDGDGTQSRDMCHVDNVVEANVLAAKSTLDLRGRAYNVACGDRTTNNQILEYLKMRYPMATSYNAPYRAGDVMHTQADISRIREELGYEVKVRFFHGLERTIEWYETSPFAKLMLKV
jgi:nucleoside-diphosphate-sugar epimerase